MRADTPFERRVVQLSVQSRPRLKLRQLRGIRVDLERDFAALHCRDLIQPREKQQAKVARLTPFCLDGFAHVTLCVRPGAEWESAGTCSLPDTTPGSDWPPRPSKGT
jgi:hypothetical protein